MQLRADSLETVEAPVHLQPFPMSPYPLRAARFRNGDAIRHLFHTGLTMTLPHRRPRRGIGASGSHSKKIRPPLRSLGTSESRQPVLPSPAWKGATTSII